jgi:hypothetical protein
VGLLTRAILLAVPAMAAAAGSASAASYDQYACRLPGGGPAPADGFAGRRDGGIGSAVVDQCASGGDLDAVLAGPGSASWHYVPPAGTSIAAVRVRRRVVIGDGSRAQYALAGSDDRCDASAPCGEGVYDLGAPPGGLDFRLSCPAPDCDGGGRVSLEAVRITLTDDVAPQLSGAPGGGLFASEPLSGEQEVTFAATDAGGGVYQAALVIDGTERPRHAIAAGRPGCRTPFTRAAPCPQAASGTLRLDTRTVADGRHSMALAVYDATGANRALYGPVDVAVANRHPRAGGHHRGSRPAARPRAPVRLSANRSRLDNGENLTLLAWLAAPAPASGGRVAFQVLIAGRWRTFATRPLGPDGIISLHHRFHATFRRLRYRFRAVIAGGRRFPFAGGHSRAVDVVVG